MEVSIRPLQNVQSGDNELPSYHDGKNSLATHVSIRNFQPGTRVQFDSARFTLQGVVLTRVGTQRRTERILHQIVERQASDFVPRNGHANSTAELDTVIYFTDEKRSAAYGAERALIMLPNFALSGNTYITKHTATTDQHRVHGTCETKTWITTELLSNGRVIHRFETGVDTPFQPSSIILLSAAYHQGQSFEVKARKRCIRFMSYKSKMPDRVKISIIEPQVEQQIQCSYQGTRFVAMPLKLTIGDDENLVQGDGSFISEVRVAWTKRTCFKSSSTSTLCPSLTNNGTVAEDSTVLCQGNLSLPPYCQKANARTFHGDLSADGVLKIPVPEEIDLPSFGSNLLRIDYQLDLQIMIYPDRGRKSSPLVANAKIPCRIQ